MGRTITATTTVEGLSVVWRGAHTANVFLYGREVDCFTFSWELDAPSFDDFAAALDAYLSDVDVAAMGGPETADAVEVVRMGSGTCERCQEPADDLGYATAGDLNSPRWCADCRAAVLSGMTAGGIMDALRTDGYTAWWSNTGGGVYNIEVPVSDSNGNVFAYVAISEWGNWSHADADNGSSSESVTVGLFDAETGDGFAPVAWCRTGRADVAPITDSDYVACYGVAAVVAAVACAVAHAQAL